MTDAQTEARAIVSAALPPHEQAMLGGDAIVVLADLIANALAAKDAELEGWKRTATEYASELHSLRSHLAEARKAMEAIYTEARSLPAHTSAVTREHVLTSKLAVIRDAARRAREQGGENV